MNHADHSYKDCPELSPEKPNGLYPTKTRLALLREVAAERITRNVHGSYDANDHRVTAAMIEMRNAGWVHLVDLSGDFQFVWKLTDAGRAVLDGAK